jgi:hypothetical protein
MKDIDWSTAGISHPAGAGEYALPAPWTRSQGMLHLQRPSVLCWTSTDVVGVQRHRAVPGHGAAGNRCASGQRDAREGEDVSGEDRVRAQDRGTPDLPEDVAKVTGSGHENGRAARSRERAPDLEDEYRAVVTLGIESERSGQQSRRREAVDARGERESSQVMARQIATARVA